MNLWRKTLPPPASSESLRSLRETSSASGEGPYPVWVAASQTRSRPLLHIALFVLTLVSMTAAGAMQQGVNPFHDVGRLVHLVEGIPFAATLLCILTVHEFGHYFAARRWKVKASLPYFLPLPYVSFLGTLGAVIRLRSPIPHKRALLDIGASGPLAGFVVAVAACVIGLAAVADRDTRILLPDTFQSHRADCRGSADSVCRPFRAPHAGSGRQPTRFAQPRRLRRLGGPVYHRFQPVPRWPARRRTYRVRAVRALASRSRQSDLWRVAGSGGIRYLVPRVGTCPRGGRGGWDSLFS